MKKHVLFTLALILTFVCKSFSSPQDGVKDMEIIHRYVQIYRARTDGKYPKNMGALRNDMFMNKDVYGYKNIDDYARDLKNEDVKNNKFYSYADPKTLIPYIIVAQRSNGSSFDSPLKKGERDLLGYSKLYISELKSRDGSTSAWGNWLILWNDGHVELPPFDTQLYSGSFDEGFRNVFWGQAGIGFDVLTYSELNGPLFTNLTVKPGNGVYDNGGPESLIQFSRRRAVPNIYGIDRENLWKTFNPSQTEFTLANIGVGATKMGLDTQSEKQTLAQLQKSGTPALLFLQDDGRIVTLTAIDDDRAVIVDRGLTQNVERSVLEKRYGGEALVPTKALTQNAAIVADDAVREVKLPSLDAEVPQQFVLRNTGDKPITLQLEYPLLGVTESKLSRDVIAPGETATLDLKVKWRSILKAPYQNVLVSIATNDPIVPRLQLAILLTPPATANAK